jgi:hypothetical protein
MVDSDGLQGAPWYIQFAVRVGVPTAFASVLLWYLLTNVTGALNTVQNSQITLQQTQGTVIQNQARIIELLNESRQDSLQSREVLQAMCVNSARNETERNRCLMGSN